MRNLFNLQAFLANLLAFAFLFAPNIILAAQFEDPTNTGDLYNFLSKLIDAGIKILFPFVVLMILYSGFLFVIARGNRDTLNKAKDNFIWTIVGVAILLGAKVISYLLQNTTEAIIN